MNVNQEEFDALKARAVVLVKKHPEWAVKTVATLLGAMVLPGGRLSDTVSFSFRETLAQGVLLEVLQEKEAAQEVLILLYKVAVEHSFDVYRKYGHYIVVCDENTGAMVETFGDNAEAYKVAIFYMEQTRK